MTIKNALVGSCIALALIAGGITATWFTHTQATPPMTPAIVVITPTPTPSVTYLVDLIPPAMPNAG
jgi:hypothetical protein